MDLRDGHGLRDDLTLLNINFQAHVLGTGTGAGTGPACLKRYQQTFPLANFAIPPCDPVWCVGSLADRHERRSR